VNVLKDETAILRCLELAASGLGSVQPNPMVGCVITAQGQIIGEGWHKKYGETHAEVNALAAVKNLELLTESTLYVNLEPCSHFGKTPPCADAVIAAKIPKVVIGTMDTHEKVCGRGIQKLKDAGIEVITGVLEKECKYLNRRFFTYHEQKRPYIILKWAQTADGFMDVERNKKNIEPYWITNTELKTIVHKWRSEEDAILVGYNTWKNDHPQLTNRFYTGKTPKRFVMISSQRGFPEEQPTDVSLICDDLQDDDLSNLLKEFYNRKIQSVIIEGGRKTLDRFLHADMWDEARILIGDVKWGKGCPAPCLNVVPHKEIKINHNLIRYVRRHV
jgi:diaminohydroxyphosphoribosylaminopyrimidine deaminase/5-amino-6-(5-phosphoribosylamino)uracil reductase